MSSGSAYAIYPNARKSAREKRQKFTERLAEVKLASGCVDCGYSDHPAALQFDHVDPSLKTRDISSMSTYRWDRVLVEIGKCVVRCANCHAVKSIVTGEAGRPRKYDLEEVA